MKSPGANPFYCFLFASTIFWRRFKSYASVGILITMLMGFVTKCTKYPENTLWFRNPEKTALLCGHVTMYDVNGIDSLDALNAFIPTSRGTIRDCRFTCYENHGLEFRLVLNGCSVSATQEFITKKKVKLRNWTETGCITRNIFFYGVTWDVIHIHTKNQPCTKISTTLENGNKYTIVISN